MPSLNQKTRIQTDFGGILVAHLIQKIDLTPSGLIGLEFTSDMP
jgi:hypothetical protein